MGSHNKHGDLPEDIVSEILLRLPVKTLLKFKCVSKHWYVLIESPYFRNQHFVHDSNQEHLLINHYKPDKIQHECILFLGDSLSEYEKHEMPDGVAFFIGPLNGIFCVVSYSNHIALVNPATRQYTPLPHANATHVDDLLGFGLDPLSGDYKLVLLEYFWDHYPGLVSVYNSGSNSWRQFEDVDFVNSRRSALRSMCNTYWNGVYYWLTKYDENDHRAILAFDMSGETFYEVQVPDCIKDKDLELGMYCDSIALVSQDNYDPNKQDTVMDVWVMMTKEGCWTKSLRIGPLQGMAWPVGFWKNIEVLLETEKEMLNMYGINTKKFRVSRLGGRRVSNWAYSYKESLLSIDVKGGKWKQWDVSCDDIRGFFEPLSTDVEEEEEEGE